MYSDNEDEIDLYTTTATSTSSQKIYTRLTSNTTNTSSASIPTLSSPPSIAEYTNPNIPQYGEICLADIEWDVRVDDRGVSNKDGLPKKTYKQAKIPAIIASGKTVYYYSLSIIAIDFLKRFASENELEQGWDKVPKKLDAKLKIITSLIDMRREG